ncbi:hypothetical protein OKW47_006763 [Paraburkholderia atlantica]
MLGSAHLVGERQYPTRGGPRSPLCINDRFRGADIRRTMSLYEQSALNLRIWMQRAVGRDFLFKVCARCRSILRWMALAGNMHFSSNEQVIWPPRQSDNFASGVAPATNALCARGSGWSNLSRHHIEINLSNLPVPRRFRDKTSKWVYCLPDALRTTSRERGSPRQFVPFLFAKATATTFAGRLICIAFPSGWYLGVTQHRPRPMYQQRTQVRVATPRFTAWSNRDRLLRRPRRSCRKAPGRECAARQRRGGYWPRR